MLVPQIVFDRDTYMRPAEALEFGLIDEVHILPQSPRSSLMRFPIDWGQIVPTSNHDPETIGLVLLLISPPLPAS